MITIQLLQCYRKAQDLVNLCHLFIPILNIIDPAFIRGFHYLGMFLSSNLDLKVCNNPTDLSYEDVKISGGGEIDSRRKYRKFKLINVCSKVQKWSKNDS